MTDSKQIWMNDDFPLLMEEIDGLREICTKLYCLEYNLDFDEARDYEKASLAVSEYRLPFTRDKAWIIENSQYLCSCEISEYALGDAWSELIKTGENYRDKINGAIKSALKWTREEQERLREHGCPIDAEDVERMIAGFINNHETREDEDKRFEIRPGDVRDCAEKSDCSEAAVKVMEWARTYASKTTSGSANEESTLMNSNYSHSVATDAGNAYDVQISAKRIASLYEVLGALEIHYYTWRSFRDNIFRAGKRLIERGKRKVRHCIDKRKRAAILRDEKAIKSSIGKVRTIIRDLKRGEYKKSRWYNVPAATCPNPWKDTSVTLLNPLKYFRYCKPVKDCILYHEYQHHHQYETWRRENPKIPVGHYLNEIVQNEIKAYKATLLCLDSKLKEIQLMRIKGEI